MICKNFISSVLFSLLYRKVFQSLTFGINCSSAIIQTSSFAPGLAKHFNIVEYLDGEVVKSLLHFIETG